MSIKQQPVQEILNAFLDLFTQPFEQDVKASVTSAATAIMLAFGISSLQFLVDTRILQGIGGDFAAYSFVLIVVWMLLTVISHKQEERMLAIARNLSVLSFWIAGTLVVVLLMNVLRPDPLDGALRRVVASITLIPLISTHMFCNLPFRRALTMTFFLFTSTVFLVYVAL